jgi:subtilisin family serine protease
MRFIRSLSVILLAAAAACADQETPVAARPTSPGAAPVLSAAKDGIAGSYIVVLNEGADPRAVAAVAGVSPRYVYSAVLNGFGAELNPGQLHALSHHPNVAYIEQNAHVTASATQSGAPWGLDRIDQRNLPLSTTYTYTSTGAGVRVYIIDSGILTSHTEFGGRASVLYDALGGNGQDCNGHGTHVAGIVGGSTYGVAKNVSLIAVRVTNCIGSGNSMAMMAGMDSAAIDASRHGGPAVANISLGQGASQAIDDAVNRMVARGVTVVVAAGNDARDACLDSPARAPNAITVANSTSTDARATTSNFGNCVDLFAPGTDIPSALSTSNTATGTLSGTSMASPHGAGVAALYLQGNPTATPAAVAAAIINSATTGKVTNRGTGSPSRLLYSVLTTPPLGVTITGPTSITTAGTYTWQANASGALGTYTYSWEYRVQNGTWTPVGTGGATYSRTVATSDPSFELRVTVTSGGLTSVDTHLVNVLRARVIWIQPYNSEGIGSPGSLIVAGEAAGAPAGTPVAMWWRNVSTGGPWVKESYAPTTLSNGIWMNEIRNANYLQQYQVYVEYQGLVSATCTYAGGNTITWC